MEDADRRPRLGRFEALDRRPVNLDGFAERDDGAGLVAFARLVVDPNVPRAEVVRLEAAGAPLCAALVREAAEVYARRGLLKPG